jgi:hypothetical protein
MTLRDHLVRLTACPEAVDWAGDKSVAQAWAECERGDWMLWLAGRVMTDRRPVVLAACDCAESAAIHWTDDTATACLWAIDAARRWARSETDTDEVRAAAATSAAASYDATSATAAAAAASASAASASASYAAASAASAAYSAAAAYYASAADASYSARSGSSATSADIVRSYISGADIERAMR